MTLAPITHRFISSPEPMIRPYVSTKPTVYTARALVDFCKTVNLDGAYSAEALHCTIIYGLNEIPYHTARQSVRNNITHIAKPFEMTIFGEGENSHLVMLLECESLHRRYNHWKSLDIDTSYPEYKPHITLFSNPHKHNIYHDVQSGYERMQEVCKEMNEALLESNIELYLTGEKLEKIVEDWTS